MALTAGSEDFSAQSSENWGPLSDSLDDLLDVSAPTIQRFLPLNEKVVPLINSGHSEIVPA